MASYKRTRMENQHRPATGLVHYKLVGPATKRLYLGGGCGATSNRQGPLQAKQGQTTKI